MKFYLPGPALAAVALLFQTTSCSHQSVADREEFESWPTEVPDGPIRFERDVRPLLIINCLECHNNQSAKENGNLSLETKKLALSTGDHPPVIIPGKPDESLLINALMLDGVHYGSMPPTPDKIWGVRMEILRRWIEEGAEWPESVRLVHPADL